MGFQEDWQRALSKTEIIRARVSPLSSFSQTRLPYIFLGESSVNYGDSVVRKGEVIVEKPALFLPSNLPQFEGFEGEKSFASELDQLANLFLVRGIRFPSFKYNNKTHALEVYEGRLKAAIQEHSKKLQQEENTSTGLIVGPEDLWAFSVMIFICHQVVRDADRDLQNLLEKFKNQDS